MTHAAFFAETASAEAQPMLGTSNDLLASVMAYEHLELVERYKRKLDLSQDEAETLFADTKRYLYLVHIAGRGLAPTPALDAGWHEFLMYTRDYQAFCNQFFGRFIHHVPNPRLKPHRLLSSADTVELATEHFGELSSNWDLPEGTYMDPCCPDYDCGDSA
jgi:uncharacterized protein (TIGR02265 family)